MEEPIQRSEIKEDNEESLAEEQRSFPASTPLRLEERTTRLEEERTVNEPLHPESHVVTGTPNKYTCAPNKYTRSGRLIKRPVRINL